MHLLLLLLFSYTKYKTYFFSKALTLTLKNDHKGKNKRKICSTRLNSIYQINNKKTKIR